jgi:hypothetical protein
MKTRQKQMKICLFQFLVQHTNPFFYFGFVGLGNMANVFANLQPAAVDAALQHLVGKVYDLALIDADKVDGQFSGHFGQGHGKVKGVSLRIFQAHIVGAQFHVTGAALYFCLGLIEFGGVGGYQHYIFIR